MKKAIFICLIAAFLLQVASCTPHKPVTALHINSQTVRLESDMSKNLSVSTKPETATLSDYNLISENEFVAVCEGNNVCAINEGETYVYATSKNGDVTSNKIKIIVSNDIFEVAAKIILLSEDQKDDELVETEVTPQKASQITETRIYELPEKFTPPPLTEDNASDTVYITKSGNKFHKENCSYAKNASPVPRSEAYDSGKTPCQKCNP